jgi:hypothetical protein
MSVPSPPAQAEETPHSAVAIMPTRKTNRKSPLPDIFTTFLPAGLPGPHPPSFLESKKSTFHSNDKPA